MPSSSSSPRNRGMATAASSNLAAIRRGLDMSTIEAVVELRVALRALSGAVKELDATEGTNPVRHGHAKRVAAGAEKRVAFARQNLDTMLLENAP